MALPRNSIRSRLATRTVLVAALTLAAAGSAAAQTLAEVDGHSISLAEVEAINSHTATNPALRQQITEQLVQQQLLASTASDVPQDLHARIAAAQLNLERQTLAQYAAEAYLKAHPVSDAALKSAYAKLLAEAPRREFCMRWIVVQTPQAASGLLADLHHGAGFAQLAIEHSVGANAQLGGALGCLDDDHVPAALLATLPHMKAGQIAGPIPFDAGFAIVQLLAARDAPRPTLAQVRPKLELELRNAVLQQYLLQLSKRATIVHPSVEVKGPQTP